MLRFRRPIQVSAYKMGVCLFLAMAIIAMPNEAFANSGGGQGFFANLNAMTQQHLPGMRKATNSTYNLTNTLTGLLSTTTMLTDAIKTMMTRKSVRYLGDVYKDPRDMQIEAYAIARQQGIIVDTRDPRAIIQTTDAAGNVRNTIAQPVGISGTPTNTQSTSFFTAPVTSMGQPVASGQQPMVPANVYQPVPSSIEDSDYEIVFKNIQPRNATVNHTTKLSYLYDVVEYSVSDPSIRRVVSRDRMGTIDMPWDEVERQGAYGTNVRLNLVVPVDMPTGETRHVATTFIFESIGALQAVASSPNGSNTTGSNAFASGANNNQGWLPANAGSPGTSAIANWNFTLGPSDGVLPSYLHTSLLERQQFSQEQYQLSVELNALYVQHDALVGRWNNLLPSAIEKINPAVLKACLRNERISIGVNWIDFLGAAFSNMIESFMSHTEEDADIIFDRGMCTERNLIESAKQVPENREFAELDNEIYQLRKIIAEKEYQLMNMHGTMP